MSYVNLRSMRGFGTDVLPGIPGLPAGLPQIGFVSDNGIWRVDPASKPLIDQALPMAKFVEDKPAMAGAVKSGSLTVVLGTPGDAADLLKQAVAAGGIAVVEKASLSTAMPKVAVFMPGPAVFALVCDSGFVGSARQGPCVGTHAVVDAKPDAISAMIASVTSGKPSNKQPGGEQPGGQQPGGQQPAPSGATETVPGWVYPTMAGLGAFALLALVIAGSRKGR